MKRICLLLLPAPFIFLILLSAASCKKEKAHPLSLWYLQPAEEWMQATPVGNGRLGVMIYGETETIALNEITL
jgi:alpha-L-fucosidase 2